MRARTAVLALLLAISCRKAPGPPDPNYQEARRIYDQLYVSKLDDAYGDPQMDTVAGLLEKVDHDSVDAPPAEALLGTIKRGREEFAKSRAEREKMQKTAQDVVAAPNIDPSRVLGLDQVDAGAPPDPFGPGASLSEINAASGGCLVPGEPFRENVTNRSGTVYRLSSAAACTQRLAGFVGQMVLVTDGRIYRRMPDSEARQVSGPDAGAPPADAGTPAPDAGTQARSAPAANSGAATDAGTTEQFLYIPGAPLPPGMQFPGAGTAGQDAGY
ncbi:MAG: hypothetical protein E6J61_05675 [Deltaproteobacteria bacterium]|nr:MAG: hypothetical protein E6J61_05675 [Deltaproteobacteria bacterium]